MVLEFLTDMHQTLGTQKIHLEVHLWNNAGTITVRDFNTPLLSINSLSRQKINLRIK